MLMVVCLCRNEGERGPGTEEALLESSGTKFSNFPMGKYTQRCAYEVWELFSVVNGRPDSE